MKAGGRAQEENSAVVSFLSVTPTVLRFKTPESTRRLQFGWGFESLFHFVPPASCLFQLFSQLTDRYIFTTLEDQTFSAS
jgi:hypothetical protein